MVVNYKHVAISIHTHYNIVCVDKWAHALILPIRCSHTPPIWLNQLIHIELVENIVMALWQRPAEFFKVISWTFEVTVRPRSS